MLATGVFDGRQKNRHERRLSVKPLRRVLCTSALGCRAHACRRRAGAGSAEVSMNKQWLRRSKDNSPSPIATREPHDGISIVFNHRATSLRD
jgi:hypothetical protein